MRGQGPAIRGQIIKQICEICGKKLNLRALREAKLIPSP